MFQRVNNDAFQPVRFFRFGDIYLAELVRKDL
jgi:hypothetical protein